MTFHDLSSFYTANQALPIGLGTLTAVAVLLVAAHRLRAMKEHRATLLIANILTILAAALATMVSASGMWKFFTDILGETPLRIAFFAFIEIALFACALLARSRLLREPENGTTGVDGIAVWVLAALTATLSALDADTFREVCLRLVAPLVAAWMWERALAAERHVRLGKTSHRINWALTPQRLFVWLRLAEAGDRDVSQVDRARRRARLGRARLHLHLLHARNASAWRVRRAHRKVIRQAMRAAEHLGLADFPDAANERQAIQMYMATMYGFVDATSPQAVTHLHAWQTAPRTAAADRSGLANDGTEPAADLNGRAEAQGAISGIANGAKALTVPHSGHAQDNNAHAPADPIQNGHAHGRYPETDAAALEPAGPPTSANPQPVDSRQRPDREAFSQRQDRDNTAPNAAGPTRAPLNGTHDLEPDHQWTSGEFPNDDRTDDEADLGPVEVMRRLWDREVGHGRVPTGAELSRAAGVPPETGLGRRKRREWVAELPEPLKTEAGLGR